MNVGINFHIPPEVGLLMPQNGLHLFGDIDILARDYLFPKHPGLPQVVAQRTTPGILIFTASSELVYINAEARKILTSIAVRSSGPIYPGMGIAPLPIPETVTSLCTHLKLMVSSHQAIMSEKEQKQTPSVTAVSVMGSEAYSFRAFFLSNYQNADHENSYILVLIERVSQAKKINITKAAQHYSLSKREIDVVELLLLGHKNKEIAGKLYVCIYTVEDHLKNIMKKMQVSSRTGVIAKLMEGE